MRIVCVAVALGFAVSPMAYAQDGPDRAEHVDALMAASSAASVGSTLQALGAAMELAPQRPPAAAARQALQALCEQSFPLDSTAAYMRTAFEGRYNPAQFDRAIEWFRSPLGRKVASAERSAALLKGEQRQEVREKVRSQWSSSRRLLLLERLDGNLRIGSLHQRYALALLEDFIAGAPSAAAPGGQPGDAQLQRRLLLASDRLASRLPDSLMLDMKMAYRHLSNDDLQGYNEFLESSGGRWYTQMLQEGLENAFLSGRERFIDGATAMATAARKAYEP